jgi:DNA-binding winged helix-turn-helix (wHTH) protein
MESINHTQTAKSNVRAFLIVESGMTDETVRLFTLTEHPATIGRPTETSNPDIKINDPQISRKHAEVYFKDGHFWLCDTGSKNGTMLDGQIVDPQKTYRLANESEIGLAILNGRPRAVLRFKQHDSGRQQPEEKITPALSWLKMDDERKEVRIDGNQVDLPKKEYSLLQLLHHRAGKVCSRDEIIAEVWPESSDPGAVSDATIDQLVRRLRLKIEPIPSSPTRIISKKSFGYVLALDD